MGKKDLATRLAQEAKDLAELLSRRKSAQGKYQLPDGQTAEIKSIPGEIGPRIEIGDKVVKLPQGADELFAQDYLKQNYHLPDQDLKKINAIAGAGNGSQQKPQSNPRLEYLARRGILGLDAFDAANTQPEKLAEMFPQAYPPTIRNKLADAIGVEGLKETYQDVNEWEDNFAETAGSSAGSLSPKQIEKAAGKLTPDLANKLRKLAENPQEGIDMVGKFNGGVQTLKDLLGNVGRVKAK